MADLTPADKRKQTMVAKYGVNWSVDSGKRAAAKNKANNPDHYKEMALKAQESYMSKPKSERKPRGWAANPKLAQEKGRIGGQRSKRGATNG